MNFTKQHIVSGLVAAMTSSEDKAVMQAACDANMFFVDVVGLHGGGYSIGNMDDDLPWFNATQEEAEKENSDMKADHTSQIEAGDRDEDDTYDWEVMRVSITADNEISLYPLDDVKGKNPLWVGNLKFAMGH